MGNSCKLLFFLSREQKFQFFKNTFTITSRKSYYVANKFLKRLFTVTALRPCHSYGLPARKYERSSHSIKWKMSPLTSDTSPPTSCFWPSFMRGGVKMLTGCNKPALYTRLYHKIGSRWKTKKVHAVLVGCFFFFFLDFSHDSYWNIFDLVLRGWRGAVLFGPMRRGRGRAGVEDPRWIFQITRHPSSGCEGFRGLELSWIPPVEAVEAIRHHGSDRPQREES